MSSEKISEAAQAAKEITDLNRELFSRRPMAEGMFHRCISKEDLDADWSRLEQDYLDEEARSWGVERVENFLLGRRCAELTLRSLGTNETLKRDSNGPIPLWPSVSVGSLSHSRGVAVAVAAQAEKFHAVGIDLERIRAQEKVQKIAIRALNQNERDILGGQSVHSLCVISAKEAAYKMLSPFYKKRISFEDFEICKKIDASQQVGVFNLKLTRDEIARLNGSDRVQIHFCMGQFAIQTLCFQLKKSI